MKRKSYFSKDRLLWFANTIALIVIMLVKIAVSVVVVWACYKAIHYVNVHGLKEVVERIWLGQGG